MFDLRGIWKCELDDGSVSEIRLPGTLDESGIGHEDTGSNVWHPADGLGEGEEEAEKGGPISTRLTRLHTYEGVARISKTINLDAAPDKRYFVYAERARHLRLLIDDAEAPVFSEGTISTPWIFEVTGLLKPESTFTFLSDNGYGLWPKSDILFSSAATDESQTNWNGILGEFGIIEKNPCFIKDVFIYFKDGKADCRVNTDGPASDDMKIVLEGEGVEDGKLSAGLNKWDLNETNLHELVVKLIDQNGVETDSKKVTYGIREFGDDGSGHLALNGRRIFLRGETNSAIYPETGHPPMDDKEWMRIMTAYKSYGVNFVRFHSNCPPDAAFRAADKLGMLIQPELSHWNPRDAFSTEESRDYYKKELVQIIRCYNHHPSFVMMTLGNELFADEAGHKYMDGLLELARGEDPTRLYANGANVHYGEIGCDQASDFYESQSFKGYSLRGTSAGEPSGKNADKKNTKEPIPIQGCINNEYPNSKRCFDATMKQIRKEYKKPVVGFETGQYEILPYFGEIEDFKGVTRAYNYQLIKDKAAEKGMLDNWDRYVSATGELALLGYREEIECALRTGELSGTVLLSLQDFTGQGTALVGMMDSHFRPKPFAFADPARFKAFNRDDLIMLSLERYTYREGEKLSADVTVANYSDRELSGELYITLSDASGSIRHKEAIDGISAPAGRLSDAWHIDIPLPVTGRNEKYKIELRIGYSTNEYPIWVYSLKEKKAPDAIYETGVIDDDAIEVLKNGGRVLYEPDFGAGPFKNSIMAQFTTDFWSVKTFARQEGGMGLFIEKDHPVFGNFPTEEYTQWQWYPMAMSRAVIIPPTVKPVIRQMDTYAYMRNMAMLFECSCMGGKVMVSTMELRDKKKYPEAAALLEGIYEYMTSDYFCPKTDLSVKELNDLRS